LTQEAENTALKKWDRNHDVSHENTAQQMAPKEKTSIGPDRRMLQIKKFYVAGYSVEILRSRDCEVQVCPLRIEFKTGQN
jgi:hypothetical protein